MTSAVGGEAVIIWQKEAKGSETFLLAENQSTYIPLGETHSLENPGKVPLEMIEVQSGEDLGEDDIIRYEDSYGRSQAQARYHQ